MWVALDRGLRLAEKHSNLPLPQRDVWRDSRDRLYEEVMEKGFNKDTQTFTQTYENDALDASLLIMVLTFFINGNDPRFLSTLQAILRKKEKGGLTEAGLVFRYDTDKIDDGTGGGEEGGFSMCICWAIEALTRAGEYEPAYLDQASIMLEDFLGFSNHLGLMSEEISKGGEQLGNTPQVSLLPGSFSQGAHYVTAVLLALENRASRTWLSSARATPWIAHSIKPARCTEPAALRTPK